MVFLGYSSDLCGVHITLSYTNILFLWGGGLGLVPFCGGRSVNGVRKSVELCALGLWWLMRPCGMSRIAVSVGIMLEDCVGRNKPSLVHTDSWDHSLGSAIHQTVNRFSLGES